MCCLWASRCEKIVSYHPFVSHSNMCEQPPKCIWAEDDFTLPEGVIPLDHPEPKTGRTYVMYHGTSPEVAKAILENGFQPSTKGMLGPGVYLSRDLQKASRYPIKWPEHERVVLRVKVNVGKVRKIDNQDHPDRTTWHRDGSDTAWVPANCGMVKSGLEENCVWDPARITVMGTIAPKVVQP